jgi:hypothetical protein
MLSMLASEARQRTKLPSLHVELTGHITATGAGPPDCPRCGGELDLCQPDSSDHTGAHLVGACLDCGRLSYLVGAGELTVAWPLPTSDELSPQVFLALGA